MKLEQELEWVSNEHTSDSFIYARRGFVIGEPKPTGLTTTVQELNNYGLIGIYKVVNND